MLPIFPSSGGTPAGVRLRARVRGLAWLVAGALTGVPALAAVQAAAPAVEKVAGSRPAAPAEPAASPVSAPVSSKKAAPTSRNRNKTAQAAPAAAAVKSAPDALAVPPAPPATGDSWDIVMADRTLNGAMNRWAAAAGWQLLWELPVDYSVQARTTIPGKFEDAVTLVVASMEQAEIPMKAVFYKGNKVLRIMAKGAQ